MLSPPGCGGIRLLIAHAWDDLPERHDAARVNIPGADPAVRLGGYLFQASSSTDRAVIVIHGYASDATATEPLGLRLAAQGWTVLCLSQRGWLGSTGSEDQGLRQPDDILSVADWLEQNTSALRIGLLGFSQGGQVALLPPRASRVSRRSSPFSLARTSQPGRTRSKATASRIILRISSRRSTSPNAPHSIWPIGSLHRPC